MAMVGNLATHCEEDSNAREDYPRGWECLRIRIRVQIQDGLNSNSVRHTIETDPPIVPENALMAFTAGSSQFVSFSESLSLRD